MNDDSGVLGPSANRRSLDGSTSVEEAVGGSVESNAAIGQDGPGSDTNLPDEELLMSSADANSTSGLPVAGFGVAGLTAASVLAIRRRRD